jgi:diguanylate cyclase (GGDEF)-like protein/PAS domain S-box-containing protein
MPAGYFAIAYSSVDGSLQTKAEVKAANMSNLVNATPELWRFQEHRLEEILARDPVRLDDESARVLYWDGTVVAQSGSEVRWPFHSSAAPIFDAGDVVGRLEIRHSLIDLVRNTLIVSLFSIGLAIVVFVTIRALPLRALNRVTDALMREKERAVVTLDSIGDAVITTNAQGHIEMLNPVAEKLTGWTEAEAHGRPLLEVFVLKNALTGNTVEYRLPQALREKHIVPLANHTVLVRRDGSSVAIEDNAAPILGDDGTPVGGVLVFRDVSAARQHTERLSWQASHDALTGLANRKEFDLRLEDAIRSAQAESKNHALCYIDLDQFKVVNDTCGHTAGDELLKQIALLLKSRLRASDTLARLGGDEFAVLFEDCSLDKAQEISEQLLEQIRTFRFVWANKIFSVGASMGIVAITQSSSDARHIVSIADTACYSAKEAGRNRIHVFRYGDAELTARSDQMDWVSRLTRALEQDRFRIYGQSYLALSDGTRLGAYIELLLRLVDLQGGIVSPTSFVPAAERYNLMPAVDRWMVSHAFQAYRELSSNFGPSAIFGIDLSGTSLSDDEFADFIVAEARHHSVPPQAICFEISETAAINQLAGAAAFIRALRNAGFKFALDHFGLEMSSFGYLKNLPVDYLKIDGSFVKDIDTDRVSLSMVTAINQIAHTMGLRTVAEHVDDPGVLQILRDIGIDYAQGYLIDKPQPLSEMSDNVTRSHFQRHVKVG